MITGQSRVSSAGLIGDCTEFGSPGQNLAYMVTDGFASSRSRGGECQVEVRRKTREKEKLV
jgi:hypothetical protein